jgi:DNA invertase Pin-like site-specific DNA recombinase
MSTPILPNGTPQRQSPTAQLNGQVPAAIYARVPTQDQADKGYSLPTQIEACLALARQKGYAVPETHTFQDDYTGMSLHRPQFKDLRALVQERLVKAVMVHDLDRLSRKLAHQLLLSEEFEAAGVALHIVTMPDQSKTPEAQLLADVRGIIAEYERAKLLERTARGRRGRAQAGHVPSGQRLLGYRYVKHADKGAHYEIHPSETTLVRRIFQLYVEGGYSLYAIAALLNAEGVSTPRAQTRVWHPATIAAILHNTAYIGVVHDGKTQRLPGKTNPDKKTRHRCVPREEWVLSRCPRLSTPRYLRLHSGNWSATSFGLGATAVDARRVSAEQELARLDAQASVLEQGELEMAILTDYCQRVAQNLRVFDLAEKRLALGALNIRVIWYPDQPLEIQGSIPIAIASNAPHCVSSRQL